MFTLSRMNLLAVSCPCLVSHRSTSATCESWASAENRRGAFSRQNNRVISWTIIAIPCLARSTTRQRVKFESRKEGLHCFSPFTSPFDGNVWNEFGFNIEYHQLVMDDRTRDTSGANSLWRTVSTRFSTFFFANNIISRSDVDETVYLGMYEWSQLPNCHSFLWSQNLQSILGIVFSRYNSVIGTTTGSCDLLSTTNKYLNRCSSHLYSMFYFDSGSTLFSASTPEAQNMTTQDPNTERKILCNRWCRLDVKVTDVFVL